MNVLENYDLTKWNTFGVKANARFFVEIESEEDLHELFQSETFKQHTRLFLGGGSNILFVKDFDGIVVANKLQGISIVSENAHEVLVRSMSGVVWQDLVSFCVGRGYWGIENLSSIPGTVGGSPVQNIGAYGAELSSTLDGVEVFDIETGEKGVLSKEECELGYRDSVFKSRLKGKYFISAIVLRLSKAPRINISYKVLENYLKDNNIEVKTPADISSAVTAIRKSKLPDPKVTGNAGSFFKNVFVSKEKLDEMKASYPDLPHFEEGGAIKIPAGWLIEQCGFKGKTEGHVGMHDKQALVLVNHGGATGQEIKDFSMKIIDCVQNKFGLTLTPEVNFV
jgi:UDP-N-acetylmuramate dehydrogenase